MAKRILLTGGAGFVGSYLAKELYDRKFLVTIIDDLSNGKRENLLPGADFIKLDIGIVEHRIIRSHLSRSHCYINSLIDLWRQIEAVLLLHDKTKLVH